MCTATTYLTKDFYFGRTLDIGCSYGENVTITPRNSPFYFRLAGQLPRHYAIIGMAHIADGYPLYYDAANEKGLCIAGLNFVGNAVYRPADPKKTNLAQFELIPYLLGRCASVDEAQAEIRRLNLWNEQFSPQYPLAQLHWMICDRKRCMVLESVAGGIKLYDNPTGVLTNNPPFPQQIEFLNRFHALSATLPQSGFISGLSPSRELGTGGIGLPGDLSSPSRFVRAAFVRANSVSEETEESSVGQFFHILSSVEQQRGCNRLPKGGSELTVYTSCCNANKGIYYYTTYSNRRISAVSLKRVNSEGDRLICYPLIDSEQIYYQN